MSQVDLSRVDLNLVKIFIAIYEEKNVTRAAKRLSMSQPGVSHALRNLRAICNDPLFVRTSTGMTATALAERMSVRLRRALNDMTDILSSPSVFIPETATNQINIGLFAVHPPWLIPELCRSVQERAPGLRLEFVLLSPEAMPEAMDNRAVSLVIGTPEQVADRKRFTYSDLFEDYLTLAIGRNNAYAGDTIDMETYAKLRHMVVSSPRFRKSWIDEVLKSHGLSRIVSVVVPNQFFIADTLSTTDLVCVIMRNLVPEDDRIRLIVPPFPTEVHRFGQFTHARDDENPAILWLRDLVREVCDTHAIPYPS